MLFTAAFQAAYTLINKYPVFEPKLLPLTALDTAIPLVPWTVFIYLSDVPLCISAYLALRGEIAQDRFARSLYVVVLIALAIFVFVPTAYPRSNFPIPVSTNLVGAELLANVRAFDEPTNACPSLHVAVCCAATLVFFEKTESRVTRSVYLLWSTLIAITTLTTKQHYVVDVVAGGALAALGRVFSVLTVAGQGRGGAPSKAAL